MRNFIAFVLALVLVFSGATVLSHVPQKVTKPEDVEIGTVANLTSSESHDSNAVEVDSIRFETFLPERVLTIPVNQRFVYTPIKLGIRITNNTATPSRFTQFETLSAEIVGQDGYRALEREGARERGRRPEESEYLIALPGQSVALLLTGSLRWHRDGLSLGIHNEFGGGLSSFKSLTPGKYKLRFFYNSYSTTRPVYEPGLSEFKILDGFWKGRGTTPFVEFHLVQR